ncbi:MULTISPECIES: Xaa-Pro peptidase family protein [unclassified Pseudodesulfovibrio]|uniref:M24 family metallopeptidase n=1 Tax=unclassified Pseudodesulfovibrio TaxID=2661612 RepID=UPI000FEB6DAA|nr:MULTISPECIES: Xaa-Pro peptidase family protein [unclassified Pseudodesulfovibrio]MCJ2164014.1 Xaa-Pro peptidase family protein [Pseudodesulfovibrio sp. S3-i]RWU05349.1 aminopeptidase P family protein [Pseudodesulfovibrio sp. S3]
MFEAISRIPAAELTRRQDAVRKHLQEIAPQAGGILVFSRLNIYYLTGTFGQGVLWLPMSGQPVLLLRKGVNRAKLEAGVEHILSFKSYSELAGLCSDVGSPFTGTVAAVMSGLTWQLGSMLAAKLKGYTIVPGDHAVALAKMVKSEFELEIMRRCGEKHHRCLHDILPGKIWPGMTEREISHAAWETFFSEGHMGVLRMQAYGEEIFLGHVAAGDSGNYPSGFNGPLGLRGEHPASAFMGNANKVWQLGEPLMLDIGFQLDGYHTDKTQAYFAGAEGTKTDEIRKAHDFCIEMQEWMCATAKPGVTPEDLYVHCIEQADKRGFKEGFMGLDENQVPFVGHGIGLTIDEFPPIAKGFNQPLEQGMVIALEPKQGIRGVAMVGVENTFEITQDGCRCITGDVYDMTAIG